MGVRTFARKKGKSSNKSKPALIKTVAKTRVSSQNVALTENEIDRGKARISKHDQKYADIDLDEDGIIDARITAVDKKRGMSRSSKILNKDLKKILTDPKLDLSARKFNGKKYNRFANYDKANDALYNQDELTQRSDVESTKVKKTSAGYSVFVRWKKDSPYYEDNESFSSKQADYNRTLYRNINSLNSIKPQKYGAKEGEFNYGKMSKYMKSERTHKAAQHKITKEWDIYKTDFIRDYRSQIINNDKVYRNTFVYAQKKRDLRTRKSDEIVIKQFDRYYIYKKE